MDFRGLIQASGTVDSKRVIFNFVIFIVASFDYIQ